METKSCALHSGHHWEFQIERVDIIKRVHLGLNGVLIRGGHYFRGGIMTGFSYHIKGLDYKDCNGPDRLPRNPTTSFLTATRGHAIPMESRKRRNF